MSTHPARPVADPVESLKICMVTPAPPGSQKGNRITAERWRDVLQDLGHEVVIRDRYVDEDAEVLVALHARRSFDSIERFRDRFPSTPLIVALTGTDVYGDIATDKNAKKALRLADRLVVLQPLAVDEIPLPYRAKTRVIYQSLSAPASLPEHSQSSFDVCVLGHLRPVKDPLRTASASRHLPESSKIRVVQLGAALTNEMELAVRTEEETNPRFLYLGDVPRGQALARLAECQLLSLTSVMEGGANVIGEAIVHGVPVVSSEIPGSVGLLGADYPGYFPTGATKALTALLHRAETDSDFYDSLRTSCQKLSSLFAPAREKHSWQQLIREVSC